MTKIEIHEKCIKVHNCAEKSQIKANAVKARVLKKDYINSFYNLNDDVQQWKFQLKVSFKLLNYYNTLIKQL